MPVGCSWAICLGAPLIALVSLGAASWFYFHGDMSRAIFWLILGLAMGWLSVRLWGEILRGL